jgi:hypothetical protein
MMEYHGEGIEKARKQTRDNATETKRKDRSGTAYGS